MNIQAIKDKAQLAGFSKVLGADSSRFVLLSQKTNGSSGRKIFIDGELGEKFATLVESDKENFVMHQLLQMRALAGGQTAFSNTANAFEHIHIVGDLRVSYKILHATNGSDDSGVYITDIGFASFGKGNKPGLFKVRYSNKEWISLDIPSDTILTTNVAINGLCNSRSQAAEKIMPNMVTQAYGNRNGVGAIQNEGYSLFYNPQAQVSNGVEWKTPEQKTFNSQYTTDLLGKAMLQSQQQGKKIQWTIHGDGARLFGDAVGRLAGKKLDNHEVIFLAPTDDADLPKILNHMKSADMNLHEDVMKVNEDDWSGLANRTYRSKAISEQVTQFEGRETVANVLKAKGFTSSIAAFSWVKYATTLGLGTVFKAKAVRNMAAESMGMTDTAVNPHFHPFKDKEQFNAHANQATNNKVNSIVFLEVVKNVRKKLKL